MAYATDSKKKNHGILWTSGKFTEVKGPGGSPAQAVGVNRSGTVIAQGKTPFLWKNGKITQLAHPHKGTGVIQISDTGLVTGTEVLDHSQHGVAWTTAHPGTLHDLGVGTGWMSIVEVTDSNLLVGDSENVTVPEVDSAVVGTISSKLKTLPGLDLHYDSGLLQEKGENLLGEGVLKNSSTPGEKTLILWTGKKHTPHVVPDGTTLYTPDAAIVPVPGDGPGDATDWAGILANGVVMPLPLLPGHYQHDGSIVIAQYILHDGSVYGTVGQNDGPNPVTPVVWKCS